MLPKNHHGLFKKRNVTKIPYTKIRYCAITRAEELMLQAGSHKITLTVIRILLSSRLYRYRLALLWTVGRL